MSYSLPKTENELTKICTDLKIFIFEDMTIYEKLRLLAARCFPIELYDYILSVFAKSLKIDFKNEPCGKVWDQEDEKNDYNENEE